MPMANEMKRHVGVGAWVTDQTIGMTHSIQDHVALNLQCIGDPSLMMMQALVGGSDGADQWTPVTQVGNPN